MPGDVMTADPFPARGTTCQACEMVPAHLALALAARDGETTIDDGRAEEPLRPDDPIGCKSQVAREGIPCRAEQEESDCCPGPKDLDEEEVEDVVLRGEVGRRRRGEGGNE